jgi:hypothetical protein
LASSTLTTGWAATTDSKIPAADSWARRGRTRMQTLMSRPSICGARQKSDGLFFPQHPDSRFFKTVARQKLPAYTKVASLLFYSYAGTKTSFKNRPLRPFFKERLGANSRLHDISI